MNVLTTGESRNSATTLDALYFRIANNSTSESTNEIITTNGVSGLKLTPLKGYNVSSLIYQQAKQQSVNASIDSLITLYTSTAYAITPNLRQLLNCIFNFSITGGTAVLTFSLYNITDGANINLQSLSQTINNNNHHMMPINFNWTQADGEYEFQFRIDMSISASGAAATDANDFVSIQHFEIQPSS
jgi:hypothetical protein